MSWKVKLSSFLEWTRTENLRLLATGPSLLCSRIFSVRWSSQTHCAIHLRSVRLTWFLKILCNKAGVFTKVLEALCSNAQVARLNTTTFCGYDESAFTIFLSSLELEDLKNKDLNCTLDFLRECVLTRAFWINMYFLEKDIFMHPSPNSKVQSTLALQRRWTTAPAEVQSRNHLLCLLAYFKQSLKYMLKYARSDRMNIFLILWNLS